VLPFLAFLAETMWNSGGTPDVSCVTIGVWMRTRLIQLEQRVLELEKIAEEIQALAVAFAAFNQDAQPRLSIKTQTWYLAAHGLVEKLYPEKVEWLENCFGGSAGMHMFINAVQSSTTDQFHRSYWDFRASFATARALVRLEVWRERSLLNMTP
jgi:hypothetical protein